MATIEWREVKDDEAKMAGMMRKEEKIARKLLWSLRSPKPSQENRVGGRAFAASRATEIFGTTFFRFTTASDKFSLQSKLSRKALRNGQEGKRSAPTRTYPVAGPFYPSTPSHSNRCPRAHLLNAIDSSSHSPVWPLLGHEDHFGLHSLVASFPVNCRGSIQFFEISKLLVSIVALARNTF